MRTKVLASRYDLRIRTNPREYITATQETTSSTMPRRPEVFRVCGIQQKATEARLIAALSALSEEIGTIEATIVPSCESTDDTNVGLVSFLPNAPEFLDPLFEGDDEVLVETEVGELTIDKNFHGLTQLYPTLAGKKIKAEYVSV
jgi:hypothetical protein